jgi:hypothetical protein
MKSFQKPKKKSNKIFRNTVLNLNKTLTKSLQTAIDEYVILTVFYN